MEIKMGFNYELEINNITEMAKLYQQSIYGDRIGETQRKETEQAYLAGFYEALQITKVMPPVILSKAETELRSWFDERIKELMKNKASGEIL
jgi:hypothetical protein